MNKIDITGNRFGRLIVLGDADPARGRRRVSCRCDCGAEIVTDPRALRNGRARSCGCLQKEAVSKSATARSTHGATRHYKQTREYNIWIKMKCRCFNEADAKYQQYGGRGITVCPEWIDDFPAFLRDMGESPSVVHSIDRRNTNGNYEPSNCRWATPKEQSRNKRAHRLVTHNGVSMPLSQACEIAGINYRSALYRLNRGLDWQPLPSAPSQQEKTP